MIRTISFFAALLSATILFAQVPKHFGSRGGSSSTRPAATLPDPLTSSSAEINKFLSEEYRKIIDDSVKIDNEVRATIAENEKDPKTMSTDDSVRLLEAQCCLDQNKILRTVAEKYLSIDPGLSDERTETDKVVLEAVIEKLDSNSVSQVDFTVWALNREFRKLDTTIKKVEAQMSESERQDEQVMKALKKYLTTRPSTGIDAKP